MPFQEQVTKTFPLLFIHGSGRAAWCWQVTLSQLNVWYRILSGSFEGSSVKEIGFYVWRADNVFVRPTGGWAEKKEGGGKGRNRKRRGQEGGREDLNAWVPAAMPVRRETAGEREGRTGEREGGEGGWGGRRQRGRESGGKGAREGGGEREGGSEGGRQF